MELKAGYKKTDVGAIPEDWSTKRIKEVGEVRGRVGWKGYTKKDLVPLGPYTIGAKHIDEDGRLNLSDPTYLSRDKFIESPEIMVQQGDLLIVQRGTIGKLTIVESDIGEATINPSMVIVRFRSSTPSYVRYFLQSLQGQKQIVVDTSSTSVPMISQKQIENFQIPFPPTIEEQSAIAAALSDVDALLGALDRLIAKKRDLKQAAMQQLLTGKTRLPGFTGEWRVKRLGDVAEIVMGQSPASANYNASGHGLPLIQGNADIRDRMTIRRIYTTQVTKHGQAGDVLMSVRAPVGEVARTTFECCLGRGVCAIRYPNTFLYHALISKEADWAKLSKGSTFDSVNSAEVRAFELDWPTDPAEQIAIATLLTDMDAELAALERRQAKTRALKQGMMQELLTGSTRLVSAERADA